MAEFLYFQTLVQFRVPVNPDGTLGEPQVTKKFTVPVKGAQDKVARKSKPQELLADIGETVEL